MIDVTWCFVYGMYAWFMGSPRGAENMWRMGVEALKRRQEQDDYLTYMDDHEWRAFDDAR